MSEERKDIYQKITDQIITAIERGAGKFRLPWHATGPAGFTPVNAMSKRPYRGINILALWAQAEEREFKSGIWATYKQWQQLDAQVKKGEKATSVMFWNFTEPESEEDAEGGERTKESRWRPVLAKEYWVFNADQVDGFRAAVPPMLSEEERIENAEAFFRAVGADVRHGGEVAGYNIEGDYIRMPNFEAFRTPGAYYSILSHEYVHWTGAKSRLDRNLTKTFGSEDYAVEELIAELGAAFIGADLGLETEPKPEHASYIDSWLSVLRRDKRTIFTAAGRAQAALDFLQAKVGEKAAA